MATRQIYFTSRIARATIQIDDLINIHVILHLGSYAYSAD